MLVRSLIPAAIPGHTAEDIVTASTDYSKLDSSSSPIKIRLSSTVVRVRHLGDPATAKEVEITYSTPQGQLSAVKGKAVVMACWNMVTAFLCPELPEKQKEALEVRLKGATGLYRGGGSQLVLILQARDAAGRNTGYVPYLDRARPAGQHRGL